VTFGDINRLLINVPPGFMKSLLVNVFWPAWEWGPMGLAHLRYVSFSYGAHLTHRDNGKMMRLVTSQRYRECCVRPKWFAVRLTSAGIAKHWSARGGVQRNPPMSLLTTSIESTRLTRWNFGLVALTLLGVVAIALALMLPNSITP
jgi:hypothetical protein